MSTCKQGETEMTNYQDFDDWVWGGLTGPEVLRMIRTEQSETLAEEFVQQCRYEYDAVVSLDDALTWAARFWAQTLAEYGDEYPVEEND